MKRIISMLLILTTLFTTLAVNVSAARTEEFISEVALIYEDSVEDARKAIEGTDWKLFEKDLNADADHMIDDGVYLIYKTSTNVEDAITDLRVMDMYGGYDSSNYERQLAESREAYAAKVADLRIVANEFRTAYIGNDPMAALAKMQMAFYQDVKTEGGTETGMNMGDFFLNMPSDDEQVVQVLFEGNAIVVSNLITLLAIGISGSHEKTLEDRIAEKYAIKNELSDALYHEDALILYNAFGKIRAKLLRYDALSEEYNLTDENMTEEEFAFISEYATIVKILKDITLDPIAGVTLADVIHTGNYTHKDFYPIAAALTKGQMTLVKMGQLETILKYGAPSASPEELREILDEHIAKVNQEQDNVLSKGIDVYTGVDRSIFKGSLAMTTAATRQQALTGETWDMSKATDNGVVEAAKIIAIIGTVSAGVAASFGITAAIWKGLVVALKAISIRSITGFLWDVGLDGFMYFWMPWAYTVFLPVAVGLLVIAGSMAAISKWYNYYNPDYLEIPENMIDVRETDLGDKYIKYSAAKVFEDGKLSEKNADFNAYEGKEWNALYYTKDATAGNCLTPNFVFKDNDDTIARRHQGVAMFGEDKAFNLNSHVYNANAKGAYLTVRYSTAKKAAADMPTVIGSMFATGALYAVTALAGAGLGVGGTILFQNIKKKKKAEELVPEDSN